MHTLMYFWLMVGFMIFVLFLLMILEDDELHFFALPIIISIPPILYFLVTEWPL